MLTFSVILEPSLSVSAQEISIPSWIKNNAKWWADGTIDDTTFVSGMKFLINEGTLKIPQTTQGTGTGNNQIPSWIKNNADWWSNGQIDDNSFIQGIQYLIKEGILKVSEKPPIIPSELKIAAYTTNTFQVNAGSYDTFDVKYSINGGVVKNMLVDKDIFALIVTIDSRDDGTITLDLPRDYIGAKKQDGKDDIFIIIIDGKEKPYQESITHSQSRIITINFNEGNSDIEIIGTYALGSDMYSSHPKDSKYLDNGCPVGYPYIWSDGYCYGVPELVHKESTQNYGSQNCSGIAKCVSETITQIVDGDTIYTESYKIRLSLTNTPERDESGFAASTAFTSRICPVGSSILIDQDDKQPYDNYGRLLANVYCGGESLNSALLYNGYANILTQYCSTSEFSSERWAQDFGCGSSSKSTSTQTTKPSTSQSPSSTGNCDPSYPDFCIPSPPPDLDCKDIPQKRFTVLQPDPHRFDGDNDGVGCES